MIFSMVFPLVDTGQYILQASEKILKYPVKQFFVSVQGYNLRLDFCYELIEDCRCGISVNSGLYVPLQREMTRI